jgi:hypothetical protein
LDAFRIINLTYLPKTDRSVSQNASTYDSLVDPQNLKQEFVDPKNRVIKGDLE